MSPVLWKTNGDFVHSLVLTDVASGWTECVAMPVRNQSPIVEAMTKVASDLPFPMLGVDTDNDSAFINQTVFDHCKKNGLEQTRSRAYKKNDQAWFEQKNGSTEERIYCQACSGLWPVERTRRNTSLGADVRSLKALHQLLSAVIRTQGKDA